MLTKLVKRINIDNIKIHPWYTKLALPPPEQLPLSPDNPTRPMSRVLQAKSTNIRVINSKTQRPSASAPKMNKSKDKSADRGNKSSSYGQKINGTQDKNPIRDHNGGNTADNPSIQASNHKNKSLDEYVSAVNAMS